MAKVSFAANPTAETATQPVEVADPTADQQVAQFEADTSRAVALSQPPSNPPPAVRPVSTFSDDPEDIDFSQLSLPTLKIVQGVGDLSLSFDPGQLVVVGKGDVLLPIADAPPKAGAKSGAPQTPVNIVVLSISRTDRYSEKVSGGVRGRLFDTEGAVFAAGGTTNWDENKANPAKPYFEKLATALLLVEKPAALEDDTGTFGFELEGKKYALVMWHLKGISYTNAAKPLRTARKFGFLKAGYSSHVLSLGTSLKTYGTNSAHIPVIKPSGDTPEGLRGIVKEVLGR
jgi:hypothetical protein